MELILQLMLFGAAGGVIGEILQYKYLLYNGRRLNIRQALAVILIASLSTALYFSFVQSVLMELDDQELIPSKLYIWILVHYGLFVVLYIEEYVIGENSGSGQAYAAGAIPNGGAGVLILNGFWQVFGIGCFGAILVELDKWYKARLKTVKKLSKATTGYSSVDCGVAVINIVVGGILASLHGTENISALTALQLGASAPLIIKRVHGR